MILLDIKELQAERTGIFRDVYSNKIPKRVPVNLSLTLEFTAGFGNLNMAEAQWNLSLLEDAADKLCQTFYSDSCPFGGSMRYPSYYQTLQSQSFIMGSNGFIQHPEVVGMDVEDYDYLIEKPFDCIVERIIPRQYKGLNPEDPVNMALNLAKALMCYNNDFGQTGMLIQKLVQKYGYDPGFPPSSGGFTEAPFDFIADQLRGFREVSKDIRRIPEKLAEACDAVYPIVFKKGLPAKPTEFSYVFFPLHMPTFMREKDFAKLWWPSFKRMVDEYASMGIHSKLFCEDDWTRYIDYLYELPANTVLLFEYGDIRKIKDKLGKKHVITGLYPISMLKNCSKEECLDKAKEMLDVLAPGGNYIFSFDKPILSVRDINIENLAAVLEYVRDNGAYDNPGETAGLSFRPEDYKIDPSQSRKLESKYFTNWEEYKTLYPQTTDYGIKKLQAVENPLFQFLIYLLV